MDDDAVFGWFELLDSLDHYEVLKLDRRASTGDVERAFQVFSMSFHPDGYRERSSEIRAALDAIFDRGKEAYAVLADAQMRERYDDRLDGGPQTSPRIRSAIPPAGPGQSSRPPAKPLEERVRSASVVPFVRRAEELVAKGDFRQAKLNMLLATHHEPGNEALEDYLAFIDRRLRRG
jgi:curved DNA-binding protein CbpA